MGDRLNEYKLLLMKIVLISNSHPRVQICLKARTEESRKQRTVKKQIFYPVCLNVPG